MPFLRPNDPLLFTCINGADMTSVAPLEFRTRAGRLLRARRGTTTDGLSGPKFVKLYLQSGNSFFPAVAHDAGYRGFMEESKDSGLTWSWVQLTKKECDDLLFELCEDNGVPPDEAKLIYVAVAEFGQKAWDDDQPLRDANAPVRVLSPLATT